MTSPLILRPDGITQENGWCRLSWQLNGLGLEPFLMTHSVTEADGHLLGDPDRGDHAVAAVLLRAMQKNQDLVVEGKVSPRLLDGLETLQAIWHRWRPERYKIISIKAADESEPDVVNSNRPAVFAFSGGVDASFSLFRHLQQQSGRNNRKPGAALLVHGMDIPLQRDDFYRSAADRAERMLAGTGVPLVRMQTNTRLLGQDWEDSYGLQLSACFLLLQRSFEWAVKGSGEPYDALVLPWGSTPLTDQLCSTAAMQFEHDGCGFDRTEKVQWLCDHTQITSELRVCWAGPNLDRNCGECEKCVRTMLNFWAVSENIPAAFTPKLTPESLQVVKLNNYVQIQEYRSVLWHAERHHSKQDPILRALRGVLRRAEISVMKQKLVCFIKSLLKRLNPWR